MNREQTFPNIACSVNTVVTFPETEIKIIDEAEGLKIVNLDLENPAKSSCRTFVVKIVSHPVFSDLSAEKRHFPSPLSRVTGISAAARRELSSNTHVSFRLKVLRINKNLIYTLR